ncbi:MAG: elongation factor P [Armatimonadia bacterium]
MISTSDFKTGLTIELDGKVYQIVTQEFHKPGKGQAVVRTRLRDMETGNVLSKTFRSGEKVEPARVDRKEMQFLYATGDTYVFMDLETYDQIELSAEQIADQAKWLKDSESVFFIIHNSKILGIEVANTVDRRVIRTEPGLRGDTAQGGNKPATLEGGHVVTVPLFVNQDDIIRVDTRSGEYVTRVTS